MTMSPSCAGSSDGKARTSVARSLRRYRRFRSRIAASRTSAMPSSPDARDGARDSSHFASPEARTGRPRPSVTATRTRLLSGSTVRFVRLDDLLDELMTDDVPLVEMHERDAVDVADDLDRLDEAGRAADREVNLRDVAGDDRLRSEPEPGEEHLHLLGRRVLRLIENHERVVERPAAHERNRGNLDCPALDQTLDALEIHHVVERVVERPQIG